MEHRAKSAMGGKKKAKKAKRHVKEMRIRHAKNGGFIAQHHLMQEPSEPQMPEPEEHVLPDMAGLQAHVGDHMAAPLPEQEPSPAPSPAQGM